MNQDNRNPARVALDATLARTRNATLLQIPMDDLYRTANLMRGTPASALVDAVNQNIAPVPPVRAVVS